MSVVFVLCNNLWRSGNKSNKRIFQKQHGQIQYLTTQLQIKCTVISYMVGLDLIDINTSLTAMNDWERLMLVLLPYYQTDSVKMWS